MRGLTAETHTWLAARGFLLNRSDDFYLQLTRVRESFDPEAIHDLRVSSRRLREGVALFSDCFRKRQLAPISKELKKLISILGAIRNTDEAILFFSPIVKNSDANTAIAITNIVATLQAKRMGEQRELKRELKSVEPGSLLGRIDQLCRNPRIFNPAASSLFTPVAAFLLDAVGVREKTVLELLADALKEENVTAQHRLRIAIKRYRYRVEFLAPLASTDYKRLYNTLKEYQEILGHIHDLDVFQGMAMETGSKETGYLLVTAIITSRRRRLFAEFLQLHASFPLAKLGREIQGLL